MKALYCRTLSPGLTRLCTRIPFLQRGILPVVKLHTESASQRSCGFGVGHRHHINVAVSWAEVAAVERRHLGLGLLESRPGSVFQHPGKLRGRHWVSVNISGYDKENEQIKILSSRYNLCLYCILELRNMHSRYEGEKRAKINYGANNRDDGAIFRHNTQPSWKENSHLNQPTVL